MKECLLSPSRGRCVKQKRLRGGDGWPWLTRTVEIYPLVGDLVGRNVSVIMAGVKLNASANLIAWLARYLHGRATRNS
jgi:hypothetical protein